MVALAVAAGLGVGIAVDDNGDGKPDRYIVKTTPAGRAGDRRCRR